MWYSDKVQKDHKYIDLENAMPDTCPLKPLKIPSPQTKFHKKFKQFM